MVSAMEFTSYALILHKQCGCVYRHYCRRCDLGLTARRRKLIEIFAIMESPSTKLIPGQPQAAPYDFGSVATGAAASALPAPEICLVKNAAKIPVALHEEIRRDLHIARRDLLCDLDGRYPLCSHCLVLQFVGPGCRFSDGQFVGWAKRPTLPNSFQP